MGGGGKRGTLISYDVVKQYSKQESQNETIMTPHTFISILIIFSGLYKWNLNY